MTKQPTFEVPRDPAGLRALVRQENARGGRLQVRVNTRAPEDGPWMLIGNDSRNRRIRAAGTEAFLIDMMRSWRQFATSA